MAESITITVSVSEFTDNEIAMVIADRLWSEDNVEDLARELVDECTNEGNEDNLELLATTIIAKLKEV